MEFLTQTPYRLNKSRTEVIMKNQEGGHTPAQGGIGHKEAKRQNI